MSKVKITLVRSISGRPSRQKKTVAALGFKKMHQTLEKENTPQVAGMIDAVAHLLKVENSK
jgi:large subunit ribosomal protein L30